MPLCSRLNIDISVSLKAAYVGNILNTLTKRRIYSTIKKVSKAALYGSRRLIVTNKADSLIDFRIVTPIRETSDSFFCTVPDAIDELRCGRMIIVVDDENRENEGDFVIPAESVNPDTINFMARYGRGLICVSMKGERLDALDIGRLPSNYSGGVGTAFAMPVDARLGTSTGISAEDRCKTVKALIDPKSIPSDFLYPGHLFPLRYREGGVMTRQGHTEASIDLSELSGFFPAAVICEIMNDDGSMARVKDLKQVALDHDLKILSIERLVEYIRVTQSRVGGSPAV